MVSRLIHTIGEIAWISLYNVLPLQGLIYVNSWPIYSYYSSIFYILVTGEANFAMPCTRLTIGGFTQPGIARALIELPSNAEKGLSHRFVWLFPKPLFGAFTTLGEVDKEFQESLGENADE